MIEARGVSFRRGRKVLVDDVSVSVAAGDLVAIVGANGAGKSTLLRLLAGNLVAGSGEVAVLGQAIGEIAPGTLARLRAVMPQKTNMQFSFSAEQVVAMGRAPHARTAESRRDREVVHWAMERTGVVDLAERSFPTLSGGEQARVCFARVLAQETPIVLLDEPTAALDLRHQYATLDLARELAADGKAVVAVLHSLDLALEYASRIAVMQAGLLETVERRAFGGAAGLLSEAFGMELAVEGRRAVVVR